MLPFFPKPFRLVLERNGAQDAQLGSGAAVAYAIDGLQQRGVFFVDPGEECYEGMIVAEHCTDKDLPVNVQKAKKLTSVRASGTDRAMKIAPPSKLSLEEAASDGRGFFRVCLAE